MSPASDWPALQKGAEFIKKAAANISRASVLEVGGHTDNVGDDATNQPLSENRAKCRQGYFDPIWGQ